VNMRTLNIDLFKGLANASERRLHKPEQTRIARATNWSTTFKSVPVAGRESAGAAKRYRRLHLIREPGDGRPDPTDASRSPGCRPAYWTMGALSDHGRRT
jgi:hypothetical protein